MKYQKYLTVLQMAIGVTPSNRGSLLPLKEAVVRRGPARAGGGRARPLGDPRRARPGGARTAAERRAAPAGLAGKSSSSRAAVPAAPPIRIDCRSGVIISGGGGAPT